MDRIWRPSVTVAAIVERDGRFLCVEEETDEGLRINQPAGHLDPGESLAQGVARETLEETAYDFEPKALIGVYLWRPAPRPGSGESVTYLRFAFTGALGRHHPERALDEGIVRALWLTREELAAASERLRNPLVVQCIDDYLAGQRYGLELLHAHASALAPLPEPLSSPGLSRGSTSAHARSVSSHGDVDGRDKPGHDVGDGRRRGSAS
jgi:8-oxo-dGTP pyrophosphatase MutT (NUDIX family)